jgi:hypothetical protein
MTSVRYVLVSGLVAIIRVRLTITALRSLVGRARRTRYFEKMLLVEVPVNMEVPWFKKDLHNTS